LLCTNSLPDRLSDATREAHFAVGPALVRVVVARAIAPVFFEQPANHTEALVRLHRVALVALDKIQYVVLTLSGYRSWTSGAEDPAQYTGGTINAADSWAAFTYALRPDSVISAKVSWIQFQTPEATGALAAAAAGSAQASGTTLSPTSMNAYNFSTSL
jgi:hypothetical protein